MKRTAMNIYRIGAAMGCNRFLFWLRKIPLIRRLVPERLYGAMRAKSRLLVPVTILKGLYAFAGKFLYLYIACTLPIFLRQSAQGLSPQGWPLFVALLFAFSFLCGAFLQSPCLSPSLLKYTCVRQMGMPARDFILADSGKLHLSAFITFTPALMTYSALFGQGVWPGLLLSIELASVRLAADWLHVFLYARTKKIPSKTVAHVFAWVLLSLGLAALFAFSGWTPPLAPLLLSPWTALALAAAGLLSLRWLLRYQGWCAVVRDTCKAENVSIAAAKQSAAQNAFRDVALRDSDLSAQSPGPAIERLRGFQYLNALFFLRHRRMLVKPVKILLGCVGAATAAGVAACLLWPDKAAALTVQLPQTLPAFVFFMYLICNSIGTRMCKAMFYNCDISLLRYGWYRQRDVVLRNFAARLGRVALFNVLVAAAFCLCFLALCLASGGMPPAGEMLPFLLCLCFLAVFFSVHPLFMYYIFQPYTSQLAVKNPFFNAINFVLYLLCYLCIQINQPPRSFAFIILAATVLYCAAALLTVWKRAYKTFRVK